MPLKLNSTGGGSVSLEAASTGSTFTLTVPAITGTAVVTGSSATVTPTMLSTGAPSWDSSGNLSFNSGYGSVATAYGCRAWVNFNSIGTVTIRNSKNVTSITDNGVGNFTVNITNAMTDANYAALGTVNEDGGLPHFCNITSLGTTSFVMRVYNNSSAAADVTYVFAAVVR